jgi:hypothetical protein
MAIYSLAEKICLMLLFGCIRSSNAQFGNQTPVFEQVTQVNLGGVRVGENVNPGGLTAQIFLAVDRSGGPTNNNVYMLCSVQRQTTAMAQT